MKNRIDGTSTKRGRERLFFKKDRCWRRRKEYFAGGRTGHKAWKEWATGTIEYKQPPLLGAGAVRWLRVEVKMGVEYATLKDGHHDVDARAEREVHGVFPRRMLAAPLLPSPPRATQTPPRSRLLPMSISCRPPVPDETMLSNRKNELKENAGQQVAWGHLSKHRSKRTATPLRRLGPACPTPYYFLRRRRCARCLQSWSSTKTHRPDTPTRNRAPSARRGTRSSLSLPGPR